MQKLSTSDDGLLLRLFRAFRDFIAHWNMTMHKNDVFMKRMGENLHAILSVCQCNLDHLKEFRNLVGSPTSFWVQRSESGHLDFLKVTADELSNCLEEKRKDEMKFELSEDVKNIVTEARELLPLTVQPVPRVSTSP